MFGTGHLVAVVQIEAAHWRQLHLQALDGSHHLVAVRHLAAGVCHSLLLRRLFHYLLGNVEVDGIVGAAQLIYEGVVPVCGAGEIFLYRQLANHLGACQGAVVWHVAEYAHNQKTGFLISVHPVAHLQLPFVGKAAAYGDCVGLAYLSKVALFRRKAHYLRCRGAHLAPLHLYLLFVCGIAVGVKRIVILVAFCHAAHAERLHRRQFLADGVAYGHRQYCFLGLVVALLQHEHPFAVWNVAVVGQGVVYLHAYYIRCCQRNAQSDDVEQCGYFVT